jgi:nucleotide-binding universal stress UspA family protein
MTTPLSGICSQADEDRGETNAVQHSHEPPIVAGVDESSASAAALDTAVGLADELDAPILFVYVRRGPAGFLGEPVYQRRLGAEMARAREVLDQALKVAAGAGVEAEGMILEGSPERRIAEIAGERGARLVVVGSRRYKLGRSVSSAVVRSAGRPVLVAAKGAQAVAAIRPAA